MTATITLFANNTNPTGKQLDDNFAAYLPLTGGTLTGPFVGTTITGNILNGTTANISGLATLGSGSVTGPFAGSTITGGILNGTTGSITGVANLASLNGGNTSITGPANLASLNVGGLASVTKLEIGASASSITRLISGQGTLAFSITVASGTQDQNMALAGAQVGDSVALGLPASTPAGAGFTGFMAAAGTVTLRLVNPTTVTLGAATLTVRATATGFT